MVFTSNYHTFRMISNTFCKFSEEVFPDVSPQKCKYNLYNEEVSVEFSYQNIHA